ncbi:MAG: sigma-70 family RNA polymerase sigma factor [Anaerolineales bacterium]|nr:sigma-70 family RNA polymerase sigma factor [Anaerolineales bacterium]
MTANFMASSEIFSQYRPLLFSIAYRMLGSVMEAEDVVQEAFLRWHNAADTEIESPKSYLTAIVTRLCIDYLRLARVKREESIGSWLPEPLFSDPAQDMNRSIELNESLSLAFLFLMESLTPTERAVFLLREVFAYGYAEIADLLGRSEANCRQIFHRAKTALDGDKRRAQVSPEQQKRLFTQFLQASMDGDLQDLVSMLADDIVMYSDWRIRPPPHLRREKCGELHIGVAPQGSRQPGSGHFGNECPACAFHLYGRAALWRNGAQLWGRANHRGLLSIDARKTNHHSAVSPMNKI